MLWMMLTLLKETFEKWDVQKSCLFWRIQFLFGKITLFYWVGIIEGKPRSKKGTKKHAATFLGSLKVAESTSDWNQQSECFFSYQLLSATLLQTNVAPESRPWKRRFLLETSIFGCYVSFRECTYWYHHTWRIYIRIDDILTSWLETNP